jgi:hypothetical protein
MEKYQMGRPAGQFKGWASWQFTQGQAGMGWAGQFEGWASGLASCQNVTNAQVGVKSGQPIHDHPLLAPPDVQGTLHDYLHLCSVEERRSSIQAVIKHLEGLLLRVLFCEEV